MENQLNQRQKTILSIDWDYFNDADFKTRAEVFPHALDFSPESPLCDGWNLILKMKML